MKTAAAKRLFVHNRLTSSIVHCILFVSYLITRKIY